MLAERTGFTEKTIGSIVGGKPSVSIGKVFSVLKVLNLEHDLTKVAADDEFGRKLQDLEVISKRIRRK